MMELTLTTILVASAGVFLIYFMKGALMAICLLAICLLAIPADVWLGWRFTDRSTSVRFIASATDC